MSKTEGQDEILTASELDRRIAEGIAKFDSTKAHVELVPRPEAKPAEPVPAARAEPHEVYSFMRTCPNCGETNEHYKKPAFRCANGSCHVPLGGQEVIQPDGKRVLTTPKCWNCGGAQAEAIQE